MVTPLKPVFLTKKDFFQIEECHCGKKPFSYHNSTKNQHIVKCNSSKEEYDIKTRKWILSKKQPCDLFYIYNGERQVFQEINKRLVQKAQRLPDKDKVLEEKLRLLFQFVLVSNHTSTLDEINILVKNNLRMETRKTFYFPSIGPLKISHYESFEEYRDRIFSKKIVDVITIKTQPECKENVFCDVWSLLKLNKPTTVVKKPEIKKVKNKVIEIPTSKFIVVSGEDTSSDKEDDDSYSQQETDSVLGLSDQENEGIEEETEEVYDDADDCDDADDYGGDDGYD